MPRGKQKTDEQKLQELDHQIAEIESKKESLNSKIKALNEQKQAILDTQKQKKLEELQSFIESLGKSPDEVRAILRQNFQK